MLITIYEVCRTQYYDVDNLLVTIDMVIHILTEIFGDKLIHNSSTSLLASYTQSCLQLRIFYSFDQFLECIT
jgi:hypothetical protein